MPILLVSRMRALAASDRLAIVDETRSRTFAALFASAGAVAARLGPLEGRRVALLAPPDARWVEAFFGILVAGGVAVPLSPQYPAAELAWFAEDAGAEVAIVADEFRDRSGPLCAGRAVWAIDALTADADPGALNVQEMPEIQGEKTALLLYTSGTTGKPKGAKITHANVAIQAEILREAWGITERDVLLHALPLHHLHGLGISLLNVLLAGACARMLPRFDAPRVWDMFADVTMWMAVPTMYAKLFEALDHAHAHAQPDRVAAWRLGAASLRLATSGSAALPVTLAERWREITGAVPLERFGMTEIGVGLTNPLDPSQRRPGLVGAPPRTVEVRIVGDDGEEGDEGELWVRGPSLFDGYWGRPDATNSAFSEGWFRTGDRARRESGAIRLLGRTSVDILKSGGYKLSALEIEEALREHEAVLEVAVVGLPDETWGDRVTAAIVTKQGREKEITSESVRAWARSRLAPYKIPREVVVVASLPKNALGKVVKPEVVRALTNNDGGEAQGALTSR